MSAGPTEEITRRIGEIQPRLPAGTSLGIGLAALVVVSFPATWMFVRYFATMAHEGSHAVVGSLWGFKITHVKLEWSGAKGETKPDGAGNPVAFYFIGYLGPSLFGLGAAKLISTGHSIAVLWLSLVLLVVLLAFVKNVFGLLAIGIAGVVIFDFARHGTVAHQTMAAYGIAWLLLLSGVRGVLLHWDGARDAELLQERTQIVPATFAKIWLVGAILAVFVGARLMM